MVIFLNHIVYLWSRTFLLQEDNLDYRKCSLILREILKCHLAEWIPLEYLRLLLHLLTFWVVELSLHLYITFLFFFKSYRSFGTTAKIIYSLSLTIVWVVVSNGIFLKPFSWMVDSNVSKLFKLVSIEFIKNYFSNI
jgi:hypothetical protein